MSDLNSLLSGGNQTQTDLLVQSYLQTQQPKLNRIQNKKNELEAKNSFFTALNTRINAIVTQIDKFQANDFDKKFGVKKVNSTGAEYVTASADGDASVGTNTVKVNRLASSDSLVSNRVNSADDFGDFGGSFNFDIEVNGDSRTITVELDNTETYIQAMQKIADAVNAEDDLKISASVVKDTGTTARLSFNTSELGSDNKILFVNDDSGLLFDNDILANIGLDRNALNSTSETRVAFDSTNAGYRKSIVSELNSEAEVNGITVTRSSNNLEDVINGFKFTLNKVHDNGEEAETLTTEIDVDGVVSLLQPLLDSYNSALALVNNNKSIRRSDASANSLYSSLRALPSTRVTGLDLGNPEYLTVIGIKPDSSGNLKISDKDALKKFLEDDPQKIADVFNSSNGFISKLENIISSLKGDEGIIKSKKQSLVQQIESYDKRYDQLKLRIDSQANNLRKQYENILSTFLTAQTQYSSFSQFSSGIFSGQQF
ncbi:MAG: flagellar filament capping protein FliD [Candidatus Kapaibacterium sp.]